jgi:O-6-methylguanine DNA methyltransferase
MDDGIEYAFFETDWGWMGATGSSRGLAAVVLPQPSAEDVLTQLGAITSSGRQNTGRFAGFAQDVRDYLGGKRVEFRMSCDLSAATPFQRQVWLKAREILYGESRSYSWIAVEIGNSGACRAVGQALGKNPLPIVIPCHRVLTAHGALGGFSGGLDIKRRLLRLEGTGVT